MKFVGETKYRYSSFVNWFQEYFIAFSFNITLGTTEVMCQSIIEVNIVVFFFTRNEHNRSFL